MRFSKRGELTHSECSDWFCVPITRVQLAKCHARKTNTIEENYAKIRLLCYKYVTENGMVNDYDL
jgi:hypothetical protein